MMFSLSRYRLAIAAFAVSASLSAYAHPPAKPRVPADPAVTLPTIDAGSAGKDAKPSAMTADLFYEVLLGEISAREGDPVDGFALILDSARRTRDAKLFQRAIEIALWARSGDAALTAARAWKETLPESREARRFELQILIALGRIEETTQPLRAELAATPKPEHPALMAVIARNYARAPDKKLAAAVVEQALADEIRDPATAGAAWAAIGRVRLAAGDTSGAIEAAMKGNAADPEADAPILLALDLVGPNQPLAEPLVKRYLDRPGARLGPRMAYARILTEARRYDEATAQLQTLTEQDPKLPEPWLLLGGLQAQAHQDAAAERSIQHFVELVNAQPDADTDDARRARGLAQGYFMLSQLAERRKDYAGANAWLARIDNGEDFFAVQVRRAVLLARQGQLDEARQMVRALPALDAEDRRQKFQAEVQLLREAQQYQAAYDLLAQASAAAPTDDELLYDQAMMAEKLGRLDEMEQLLRRLIELKPDNANAYNALGYSLADRKIRLPEARELIRKAVALAPDDPFIADSLGWVEYRLGNLGEAARILEEAYKRRPDPEIAAHLGEVLWLSNQRDRALTLWKEAQRTDPDNEVLQETLKRLRARP